MISTDITTLKKYLMWGKDNSPGIFQAYNSLSILVSGKGHSIQRVDINPR